jgi:hypothetical protein
LKADWSQWRAKCRPGERLYFPPARKQGARPSNCPSSAQQKNRRPVSRVIHSRSTWSQDAFATVALSGSPNFESETYIEIVDNTVSCHKAPEVEQTGQASVNALEGEKNWSYHIRTPKSQVRRPVVGCQTPEPSPHHQPTTLPSSRLRAEEAAVS